MAKPHLEVIKAAQEEGFVRANSRKKRADYIEFDFDDHILRLYKDANGDYTIPMTIPK